jgi:hypothetical protein
MNLFKRARFSLRACLVSFFALLAFDPAAAGGDGSLVGNGGDLLFCRQTPNSEFNGFYTLDYVLDYRSQGEFSELALVHSWEQSRDRILNNLERISPPMAASFREFALSVFGSIAQRTWIAADLTTTDVPDEEIDKSLPANCYKDASTELNLAQTVVRRYGETKVEYLYDQDNLLRLKTERPLQFSFFIVHEWLWDFTTNSRDLRRFNWMLHSLSADRMQATDFSDFLLRGGFFNRFLPVCHRSELVRTEIEKSIGRTCNVISSRDLTTLTSLDLSSVKESNSMRVGDLSGLFQLRILDLSGSAAVLSNLAPYAFIDLVRLNELIVAQDAASEIPEHLREGPMRFTVRRVPD